MTETITLPAGPVAVILVEAVDHLVPGPDVDPCCPDCCRLCRALVELRDAGVLDDAVRSTDARSRVWWRGTTVSGGVDGAWLRERWAACGCAGGERSS